MITAWQMTRSLITFHHIAIMRCRFQCENRKRINTPHKSFQFVSHFIFFRLFFSIHIRQLPHIYLFQARNHIFQITYYKHTHTPTRTHTRARQRCFNLADAVVGADVDIAYIFIWHFSAHILAGWEIDYTPLGMETFTQQSCLFSNW